MIEAHHVPLTQDVTRIDALLRAGDIERLSTVGIEAPTIDSFEQAADDAVRGASIDRELLVRALEKGNAALGNRAGTKLAGKLSDPDALVVVTGQQPGPFGGAAMVHAKIMGAVALARDLEKRLERPVVPVFWNHAEDHDLEEVNRLHRPDGLEVTFERLPIEDRGVALERVTLDDDACARAMAFLGTIGIGSRPGIEPRQGEPFATWSARSLVDLLEPHAFVVFEPSWVRHESGSFFSSLVDHSADLMKALQRQSALLEEHGIAGQLQTDGLFFHLDADGRRERIHETEEGFLLPDGQTLDARDLAQLASSEPTRISMNAASRPLWQRWLFPAVAQVTGPAESAYLAQLAPLFGVLGLGRPVLLPRPRLFLLDPSSSRTAERLGLAVEDLVGHPEGWPPSRRPSDMVAIDAFFAEEERGRFAIVERTRDALTAEAGESLLEWFEDRRRRDLQALRERVERHLARREDIGASRRRSLRSWMWPRDVPQERLFGPLSLLARGGLEAWPDVVAIEDALDFRTRVVSWRPDS